MTLYDWLSPQDKSGCYWLIAQSGVDAAAEHASLPKLMEGAMALFDMVTFDSLVSLTPWLIPMNEAIANLPANTLKQGVFLHSDADASDVAAHLRSLLLAGLDGETVLFRIYDPLVITPILLAMTTQEVHAFMGNIDTLVVSADGYTHRFNHEHADEYTLQVAPWWVIKPEHIEERYNQEQHVVILSRRLWGMFPGMMSDLDNAETSISQALDKAKLQGFNASDSDLWVISQLATQSGTAAQILYEALMLDASERQLLNTWMNPDGTPTLEEALTE